MAKLSISAAPTFKAMVAIPVAGGESVEVEITFKHRTKLQLDEFVASCADKTDAETFMEMASGWEFAEEFSADTVKTMTQNYMGAGLATYRVYLDELVKAKAKN